MADSLKAPVTQRMSQRHAAIGTAGDDAETVLGVVKAAGVVSGVELVADGAITGAATNHRSYSIVNKGQDGLGTTVIATLAFDSGVDATAFKALAITLSATAANLDVAAGDVLVFQSTAIGTGITAPAGLMRVLAKQT